MSTMTRTPGGSRLVGQWGAPMPPQVTILKVLAAVAICCAVVGLYYLIRQLFKKHQAGGLVAQEQRRVLEIELPTVLPQSRTFRELQAAVAARGESECSVCLEEFLGTDLVSVLPGCNHCFHPKCIGDWMVECTRRLSNSLPTCPLCRLSYQATV